MATGSCLPLKIIDSNDFVCAAFRGLCVPANGAVKLVKVVSIGNSRCLLGCQADGLSFNGQGEFS